MIKMQTPSRLLALFALSAILLPFSSHGAPRPRPTPGPPSYSIAEIGLISGIPFIETGGLSINALGEVAGFLIVSNNNVEVTHAFVYRNGKTVDLGALLDPTSDSEAYFVNLQGEVALAAYPSNSPDRPVAGYLYKNGRFHSLPTAYPNGGHLNQINGLNDFGQVIVSYVDSGLGGGFLIQPDGRPVQLPITPVYGGINDLGQIIGVERSAVSNSDEAFLYHPGGHLIDLGNLGGYSIPVAINIRGQVIGYSSTSRFSDYPLYPFLYSGGKIVNLGAFPGAPSSSELFYFPAAFNDFDTVVGEVSDPGGSSGFNVVFVYIHGKMYDLNTLILPGSGFVIDFASGINDAGQILVSGSRHPPVANDFEHTFILTRRLPEDR